MVEKQYISADELLLDSYQLGRKILESGFHPDFLVGIWRGGTPVGIAVQEFLEYHGVETDHISVRTSAYEGIDKPGSRIRVHGLDYLVRTANSYNKLLLVDDVHDTGLSIKAVIETLQIRARKNTPHDIRVATVYYKPSRSKTGRVPEFYLHETEKWLVFPHELMDLTEEEIREFKGADLANVVLGKV